MGIFRQKLHFSKVLVVCGTRVQILLVRVAIQIIAGSLGAKLYFFQKKKRKTLPSHYLLKMQNKFVLDL
jgi:hypothetical protein